MWYSRNCRRRRLESLHCCHRYWRQYVANHHHLTVAMLISTQSRRLSATPAMTRVRSLAALSTATARREEIGTGVCLVILGPPIWIAYKLKTIFNFMTWSITMRTQKSWTIILQRFFGGKCHACVAAFFSH